MSGTNVASAKWAIEVDHDGITSPDYFAIDSLMADDEGIHIQVAGGTAIEFSRDSIRRILVVRTKETEQNESV